LALGLSSNCSGWPLVVLERPLSFCGLVTAIDPKLPDDVCKRYVSLLILKLPLGDVSRQANERKKHDGQV
jgi:hypothetical protein